MMLTINSLKLDHINFKDSNYKQLDSKKTWTVKKETECNLGKWIIEQESLEKQFTRTSNWNRLKEAHLKVHGGVQCVINDNASENSDNMLSETISIDQAINDVFSTMQQTKVDNCNSL